MIKMAVTDTSYFQPRLDDRRVDTAIITCNVTSKEKICLSSKIPRICNKAKRPPAKPRDQLQTRGGISKSGPLKAYGLRDRCVRST